MPVDAKALRDYKIGGSGGGANEWFRPKPGASGSEQRYTIRLLLKAGESIPFFDTVIHYFRSKDGFMSGACPRATGDFCLACDMFFTLRLEFENDKANKELLRKVSPTTRVYANVIDRNVDRVQVWSMPFGVAGDLKNALETYLEDGVDLTDPTEGHDITFSVNKTGAVQQYSALTVRPKTSDVGVEDWEASCHDLEAKAHSRMFDDADIREQIEKVLGDDASSMLARYDLLAKNRKVNKAKDADKDAPGESV